MGFIHKKIRKIIISRIRRKKTRIKFKKVLTSKINIIIMEIKKIIVMANNYRIFQLALQIIIKWIIKIQI